VQDSLGMHTPLLDIEHAPFKKKKHHTWDVAPGSLCTIVVSIIIIIVFATTRDRVHLEYKQRKIHTVEVGGLHTP
jgi:hypothetical protein